MPRSALYIHSLGTVSAAGIGLQELRQTLFGQHSSAMRFHTGLAPDPNKAFYCGFLSDLTPSQNSNRTAMLLELCLEQMSELQELLPSIAPDRVAVALGACTSGMHRIEEGMSEYVRTQQLPLLALSPTKLGRAFPSTRSATPALPGSWRLKALHSFLAPIWLIW